MKNTSNKSFMVSQATQKKTWVKIRIYQNTGLLRKRKLLKKKFFFTFFCKVYVCIFMSSLFDLMVSKKQGIGIGSIIILNVSGLPKKDVRKADTFFGPPDKAFSHSCLSMFFLFLLQCMYKTVALLMCSNYVIIQII